jgi:hypothetical protein
MKEEFHVKEAWGLLLRAIQPASQPNVASPNPAHPSGTHKRFALAPGGGAGLERTAGWLVGCNAPRGWLSTTKNGEKVWSEPEPQTWQSLGQRA